MDGAALFALIAAVGFGWQPMPDGSERYEYIVQVDEELAATLASGKSIPIVGEVPDDIRPIGRIRVVIGDGAPPRERMVKRLKPVVAATTGQPELAAEESIVVRGQNAVGSADYNRYGEIPQQLSQSATAAVDAAAQAWNGGSATPAGTPAPSSQALFDNAVATGQQAWNDNVAAPATNAVNNAAQNLQTQLGNSVQQGINNASNQLQQNAQNAASALGDRTSSVIDQLRNPQARQPAATSRDVRNQAAPVAAVAPPATGSAATGAPPAVYGDSQPGNSWNQDTLPATNPLQSNVQPPAPSATGGNAWNNTAATPFPTAAPLASQGTNGFGNAGNGSTQPTTQFSQQPQQQQPANGAPAANEWNNDNFAAGQPVENGTGVGNNVAANNPWQSVPDPRIPATSAGLNNGANNTGIAPPLGGLANEPTRPFGGVNSQWSGDSPLPTTPPLASETNLAGTGSTLSPPHIGTPSISVGMMDQNPNRPLDELAGAAGSTAGTPATHASTGQTVPPATMNRDPFNTPRTNQPTNGQLAGTGQNPAQQPAANANAAGNTPNAAGGRDNAFIALVAWVMLFGSAFGNLYLFWSYLDVRQKYRSLVRKTARAVGSRFSAA